MNNTLYVRVDFYNDGKMIPISFVQKNSTTKFIRKIQRIWYENDVLFQEAIRYSCLLTDESIVTLSYKNGCWYI